MDLRQVEHFSKLSGALWVNQSEGKTLILETVCAMRSVEHRVDRALQRAFQVLLKRASEQSHSLVEMQGWDASLPGLSSFYRLSPLERVTLVGIHGFRASYQDLMQLTGLSQTDLERVAWSARVQLGARTRVPPVARQASSYCLEYDPHRPWTQRMMDGEFTPAVERVSLQKHILICTSCEQLLHVGQEIYYQTHAQMEKLKENLQFRDLYEQLLFILREDPHLKIHRELRVQKWVRRGGFVLGVLVLFSLLILLCVGRLSGMRHPAL